MGLSAGGVIREGEGGLIYVGHKKVSEMTENVKQNENLLLEKIKKMYQMIFY